jgi:hypothetical protein
MNANKSNSKLSFDEKQSLKNWKRGNPDVQFFQNDRITFVFRKTSPNKGQIAWAIASNDEQKCRRKVGEFHATCRFVRGPMPIEFAEGEYLGYRLLNIAKAITKY